MKYLKYFKTKNDYDSFVKNEDLHVMISYVAENKHIYRFSKYDFFQTKNGVFIAKNGAFNLEK